jgi:hypothetical protein
MFDDDYYKQRCKEALKGNRESATDILYHIEELLGQGRQLSPAAVFYLRIAIRRILDGTEAAKALGLAHQQRGRPKKSQEQEHELLAAEIERRVRQGETLTSAYNAVSEKYGQKVRTIERAWRDYQADVRQLHDNELAAITEPPSLEELKSHR